MKIFKYFLIIALMTTNNLNCMGVLHSYDCITIWRQLFKERIRLPKDCLKQVFEQLVNRRDFENEDHVIATLNSFNFASRDANLAVKEFLNYKERTDPKYRASTISKQFTQLKLDVINNNIKERSKKFIKKHLRYFSCESDIVNSEIVGFPENQKFIESPQPTDLVTRLAFRIATIEFRNTDKIKFEYYTLSFILKTICLNENFSSTFKLGMSQKILDLQPNLLQYDPDVIIVFVKKILLTADRVWLYDLTPMYFEIDHELNKLNNKLKEYRDILILFKKYPNVSDSIHKYVKEIDSKIDDISNKNFRRKLEIDRMLYYQRNEIDPCKTVSSQISYGFEERQYKQYLTNNNQIMIYLVEIAKLLKN